MINLALNGRTLNVDNITLPPYQYNNAADTVRVSGDVADSGAWELLIAIRGYLDVIPMSSGDYELSCTLTAQHLAFDGFYTIQLRHSVGGVIWHSTPVLLAIGHTLSGDAQWPEIPTAFTEALERAEAAIQTAQEIEIAVEQARAAAQTAAAEAEVSAEAAQAAADSMSFVAFTMDYNGHLILQRSERLGTTSFSLTSDGNLEVHI